MRTSGSPDLDAVAVAVALAESGGHSAVWAQVDHPESKAHGSWDRGIFQINSYWHAEVSDAACVSPDACADAAWRISGGFLNWQPWNSYVSGSYGAHLDAAKAAVARHAKPSWWREWWDRPKPSIRMCAQGWDVTYLQDVLRIAVSQYVATTGTFDGATDKGVRNVQAFFRLTVDGVVGAQTWPVIDYLAKAR